MTRGRAPPGSIASRGRWLPGMTDFTDADLRGSRFEGADLTDSQFRLVDLKRDIAAVPAQAT
jgi:uncharacterized protein YjbI with pentapeptide repeats